MSWPDRPWKAGFAAGFLLLSVISLFAAGITNGPYPLATFCSGLIVGSFFWVLAEYAP